MATKKRKTKKKAAKKRARKKAPSKKGSEGDGRDTKTGRFKPGWKGGPGRKPGIKVDFLEAVRAEADKKKINIAEVVGRLGLKMLEQAETEDDVRRIQFIVDRLCGPVKQEIEVDSNSTATVHVAEQAREDFKRLAASNGFQDAMMDEMERRTNDEGD